MNRYDKILQIARDIFPSSDLGYTFLAEDKFEKIYFNFYDISLSLKKIIIFNLIQK